MRSKSARSSSSNRRTVRIIAGGTVPAPAGRRSCLPTGLEEAPQVVGGYARPGRGGEVGAGEGGVDDLVQAVGIEAQRVEARDLGARRERRDGGACSRGR